MSIPRNTSRSTGRARESDAGINRRLPELPWRPRLEDVSADRKKDVDHRNLNTDVPWLKGRIPTTENLALTFWERLRPELPEGLLRSVRVWETDKNWAEVGDQG